jgi:hypothetical protein
VRDSGLLQAEPAEPPASGTEVCGYRLVRVLALSAEHTTWLAVAVGPSPRVDSPEDVRAGRAVALWRFSESGAVSVPDALFSVSSPHLQRALDVATDAEGRLVLVTERIERTLGELLEIRQMLQLGEAVTILAPIVSAVEALHRSGYAHGALSPASIGFTVDGKPVLALLPPGSCISLGDRDDVEQRRRDLSSLATLATQVFDRCEKGDDDAVPSLLRWLDRATTGEPTTPFAQLDLRLFALAAPLAVDFSGDARAPAPPGRATLPSPQSDMTRRKLKVEAHSRPSGWTHLLGGLNPMADPIDSVSPIGSGMARLAGIGGWLSRAATGRAAVLVVATVIAIVGVWGGLALLPETSTDGKPGSSTPPTAPASAAVVTVTDDERAAVTADDPEAALEALLAVRSRCLSIGTENCLSLFDEAGSAAEATDARALGTDGDVLIAEPVDSGRTELLQRTGDAALFRVHPGGDEENQPVLVLVMRTNTGWRVRDLAVPG